MRLKSEKACKLQRVMETLLSTLNLNHELKNQSLDELKSQAKKSFRKLSLIHHPDRGGDESTFKNIKSAYEKIINLETIEQLSIPTSEAHFPANVGNIFSKHYTKIPKEMSNDTVVRDIYCNVNVTINELYTGCIKTIVVPRSVNNQTTNTTYQINIAPGSFDKQEIKVKGGGHQNKFGISSDLVIIINEQNTGPLQREQEHLVYQSNINLKQALFGDKLILEHPSGKLQTINYRLKSFYDQIVIPNKGMPIYGSSSYGDLKIKFVVVLPEVIPEHLVLDLHGVLDSLLAHQ